VLQELLYITENFDPWIEKLMPQGGIFVEQIKGFFLSNQSTSSLIPQKPFTMEAEYFNCVTYGYGQILARNTTTESEITDLTVLT
jgi:hypothetical protein